ncbi:MAG: hypothetical protein WCC37_19755 [Candidatus Sulfotelmatobacter sp.]
MAVLPHPFVLALRLRRIAFPAIHQIWITAIPELGSAGDGIAPHCPHALNAAVN